MRDRLVGLGRIHPFWVVITIFGVGAFALAQPLLDLLGRNPEFFIARRFPSLDIVLLAVVLMLAPAVLAAPVLALRLVGPATSAVAHLGVLALEAAVAAATVLTTLELGAWPPPLFFGVAALFGLLVAWLVLRFSPFRSGLRYLGVAPVVFLAWFLWATPVSGVVFVPASEVPETQAAGDPGPVVVLVFDELPTASLVRADGRLDAEHYPNLARLAGDGVWYRNAVGVRQQTEEALPSILTGVAVSEGSIPTHADHPLNLFTLLADDFDVAAVENVTELCPDYVCENESRSPEPLEERWQSLGSDLGVVYGHLLLPDAWASSLPTLDQGWVGFDRQAPEEFDIIERFLDQVSDDRRRELDRFLATFDTIAGDPPLRFAHFLYPHHPWDLTAEGRVHGAPRPPGRFEVGWGSDEFLVAQGWQRHLIQAQFVDAMVGRVLDRLEQDGLYEKALVAVMADHGISIAPDTDHQRVVTPDTVGSIAYVPLLVKYPNGMEGVPTPGTIDDVRAETIDLLPTVADVVGTEIPWRVDGVPLTDVARRSQRDGSVMLGTRGEVEIPPGDDPMWAVAAAKEEWFPGGDPYRLAPPGWSALLGAPAPAGSEDDEVEITLEQAAELRAHGAGGDTVPSYLSGSVTVSGGATGEEILAVVVDDVVAAVTRSYEAAGTRASWEAMVDPARVDAASDSVEIWLVSGTAESPVFRN